MGSCKCRRCCLLPNGCSLVLPSWPSRSSWLSRRPRTLPLTALRGSVQWESSYWRSRFCRATSWWHPQPLRWVSPAEHSTESCSQGHQPLPRFWSFRHPAGRFLGQPCKDILPPWQYHFLWRIWKRCSSNRPRSRDFRIDSNSQLTVAPRRTWGCRSRLCIKPQELLWPRKPAGATLSLVLDWSDDPDCCPVDIPD